MNLHRSKLMDDIVFLEHVRLKLINSALVHDVNFIVPWFLMLTSYSINRSID